MGKLTVVKVGGAVLESTANMNAFLNQFIAIDGKKILVHGGGRKASQMMETLGIPVRMVDGRRITDAQTLEVVTMVYGGLVNKTTVAALQARGCNAIGLTGADSGIILAKKRKITNIDYGYVGDVDKVNKRMLSMWVEEGLVPVIAPLTYDATGTILNTNADTIASEVAIALSVMYDVSLVYCFEKAGVLANPNDDSMVINMLSHDNYQKLKENGTVSAGMIPKLDNSYHALASGVREVVITNAHRLLEKSGTALTL